MSWADLLDDFRDDLTGSRYANRAPWLRSIAAELDKPSADGSARCIIFAAVLRHWAESPRFDWTEAADRGEARGGDGFAADTDGTGFRSPVWSLARALLWSPGFAVLAADDAWAKLLDMLAQTVPPRVVDHADDDAVVLFTLGDAYDDLEADFNRCWGKVQVPEGLDRLQYAHRLALNHPLELDGAGRRYLRPKVRLFIGTAAHLQVLQDTRPIMLPLRRMAELLNVSRGTVGNWINQAEADGFLQPVKAAFYKPGAAALAAQKRFDLSRVRGLAKLRGIRWIPAALADPPEGVPDGR